MPAKEVVTRERILQAAKELLRGRGSGAVNARGVAKALGCSTQPIYRVFKSMEGLMDELKAYAERVHAEKVAAVLAGGACKPYEAYGLGFVRFAREEKHLFRLLYGSERRGQKSIEDVHYGDIIATMRAEYGYGEAEARSFHADMAIYAYGLAFLVNTGYVNYSDDEIIARLQTEFTALARVYGAPAVRGEKDEK